MRVFLFLQVLFSCVSLLVWGEMSGDMNLPIKELKVFENNSIWFIQDKTSPKIYIDVTFLNTGEAFAPPHKLGLSRLYVNLFEYAREGVNQKEFKAKIDEMKLYITSRIGQDNLSFSFSFPAENREETATFIAKLFANGLFSEEDVNRAKSTFSYGAASNPDYIARKALLFRCFQGHPYADASGELPESIQTLRARDVELFSQEYLDKAHLKVTLLGNIEEEDAKKLTTKIFGFLPAKRSFEGTPISYKDAQPFPHVIALYQDIPQSKIAFLYPMPQFGTKEYYFACIANLLWGGTDESKLFRGIRMKQGLVYGIDSFIEEMPASVYIIGSTFTQTGQEDSVIQLIRQKFENLKKKGVSQEELSFAQNHLSGNAVVKLISPQAINWYAHEAHILGKNPNFLSEYVKNIKKIDLKELNAFLTSWVDSSKISFSVVGKYTPKQQEKF